MFIDPAPPPGSSRRAHNPPEPPGGAGARGQRAGQAVYDAGLLASRGAATGDSPLILKPFSVRELCARVDEVLCAP